MKYNIGYIDLKYTLIICLLAKADIYVLDISYKTIGTKIYIQVVLLEGFSLSNERMNDVMNKLDCFEVIFLTRNLTKAQFNESKGEWQPLQYAWFDHVLFSKAEVL